MVFQNIRLLIFSDIRKVSPGGDVSQLFAIVGGAIRWFF
jgi:hypothetical protein